MKNLNVVLCAMASMHARSSRHNQSQVMAGALASTAEAVQGDDCPRSSLFGTQLPTLVDCILLLVVPKGVLLGKSMHAW